GEISEADLYSPTVNFDRTQLDLERVIEDYEWSKKTFAKLYGGEPLRDEQIPEAIPDVALEFDGFNAMLGEFAQEKEQRSFGLQNLQRDIEIEKLNLDIASTRLKPKVNLLVGTSQDEQSYTRNIGDKYGVTAYYVGVRLEWSIFDGFATKAIKSNSVIRRRQLEHAYRETSASLLDNARVKLKQLEFTARSLAIDRKGLELNEENLERVRDNVARGLSAPSELRRAEYNHAGALINTYNARADFLVRTSDFLATILVDPAIAQLQANLR
ncbi:MAG TPA: TolC family protein, partial [Opitutus sp.]|nr:TolC family protein [Opitutus sp.]